MIRSYYRKVKLKVYDAFEIEGKVDLEDETVLSYLLNNGEKPFIRFLKPDDEIIYINKEWIMWVEPIQEE